MIRHGFPLEGCRFEWDELIDWTPGQQIQIEQMLLNNYEIDPKYFSEKYNITITGTKQAFLKDDNRFFV